MERRTSINRKALIPQKSNITFMSPNPSVTVATPLPPLQRPASRSRLTKSLKSISVNAGDGSHELSDSIVKQFMGESLAVASLSHQTKTRIFEEVLRIQKRSQISDDERKELIHHAMTMDGPKLARHMVEECSRSCKADEDVTAFVTVEEPENDVFDEDEAFTKALEEVERSRQRMLVKAASRSFPPLQAARQFNVIFAMERQKEHMINVASCGEDLNSSGMGEERREELVVDAVNADLSDLIDDFSLSQSSPDCASIFPQQDRDVLTHQIGCYKSNFDNATTGPSKYLDTSSPDSLERNHSDLMCPPLPLSTTSSHGASSNNSINHDVNHIVGRSFRSRRNYHMKVLLTSSLRDWMALDGPLEGEIDCDEGGDGDGDSDGVESCHEELGGSRRRDPRARAPMSPLRMDSAVLCETEAQIFTSASLALRTDDDMVMMRLDTPGLGEGGEGSPLRTRTRRGSGDTESDFSFQLSPDSPDGDNRGGPLVPSPPRGQGRDRGAMGAARAGTNLCLVGKGVHGPSHAASPLMKQRRQPASGGRKDNAHGGEEWEGRGTAPPRHPDASVSVNVGSAEGNGEGWVPEELGGRVRGSRSTVRDAAGGTSGPPIRDREMSRSSLSLHVLLSHDIQPIMSPSSAARHCRSPRTSPTKETQSAVGGMHINYQHQHQHHRHDGLERRAEGGRHAEDTRGIAGGRRGHAELLHLKKALVRLNQCMDDVGAEEVPGERPSTHRRGDKEGSSSSSSAIFSSSSSAPSAKAIPCRRDLPVIEKGVSVGVGGGMETGGGQVGNVDRVKLRRVLAAAACAGRAVGELMGGLIQRRQPLPSASSPVC